MSNDIFGGKSPGTGKTILNAVYTVSRKSLRIGSLLLGRYKLLAELGKGGMGVVHECFDEVGGVKVALKTLAPELSNSGLQWEKSKTTSNWSTI